MDSLSDLVRTAVAEYIATDANSSGGGLNDDVAEDMLDAVDGVDDIKTKQLQLEDQIKATRTEIPSGDEIEAIVSIATNHHNRKDDRAVLVK